MRHCVSNYLSPSQITWRLVCESDLSIHNEHKTARATIIYGSQRIKITEKFSTTFKPKIFSFVHFVEIKVYNHLTD